MYRDIFTNKLNVEMILMLTLHASYTKVLF